MMSRRTWSCSWVCQLNPAAPGMCPASYALVSTSISTILVPGLPRFSFTQSVETSTSGCAYALIIVLSNFCQLSFGPRQEAGNMLNHVRGVLEYVIGKNHH